MPAAPPKTIALAEVLRLMDQTDPQGHPIPFSIKYAKVVTARNGRTAGEKCEHRHAILKPAKGARSGNYRRIYIPRKKQPWDTIYIRWIIKFNDCLVHD